MDYPIKFLKYKEHIYKIYQYQLPIRKKSKMTIGCFILLLKFNSFHM